MGANDPRKMQHFGQASDAGRREAGIRGAWVSLFQRGKLRRFLSPDRRWYRSRENRAWKSRSTQFWQLGIVGRSYRQICGPVSQASFFADLWELGTKLALHTLSRITLSRITLSRTTLSRVYLVD